MTPERLAEIRCIISRGDTMLADLLASHDALAVALGELLDMQCSCDQCKRDPVVVKARAALKQAGVTE